VDLKHSVADFIELYLSIDLPRKDIELLQFKSINRPSADDTFRDSVVCFRNAISNAEKHYEKFRSKSHYYLPEKIEEILHLPPDDFFLLLSIPRYGLTLNEISLILQIPEDTLSFRIKHLQLKLSLTDSELKNIHSSLKSIEKRRFSQIQKLRNKLKPQRFILESMVTMTAVIFILWSIPEIRKKYENWALRKTSEYFVNNQIKDAPVPADLDKKPTIIESEEEKLITTEATIEKPKAEKKQPKVTEGEVWRFSFTGTTKGDLEKELKGIVQRFSDLMIKSSIAPGGIQFDTFIKVSDLIEIKTEFEKHTSTQSNTLKMSWYKKKMGTKKIPSAHVEVIVWISNI
jgi:hypothetical protein